MRSGCRPSRSITRSADDMTPHVSKEPAAPDPVRMVEASDGLHEFASERAEQSPVVPQELRRSRANRVREPLLRLPDGPAAPDGRAPRDSRVPARASRSVPAPAPEPALGVGLDVRGGEPTTTVAWSRLAGGVALVALVLSVAAAGIVMLRKSPPRTLATLSAPAAHDVARPDALPSAVPAPAPAARAPQPDREA